MREKKGPDKMGRSRGTWTKYSLQKNLLELEV